MISPTANRPRVLDTHVHLVGNGSGGTGCWLQLPAWRRVLVEILLTHLRFPRSILRGDLEGLYVERLRQWIRQSSLDAAVLLANDRAYEANGRIISKGIFYVPNEYLLSVARQYPEFLPGVSIHPARPDAMDELERCLEGGAALMKCLPNCHNIDCNDQRYTRFWERMAAAGLPLLAHTGGEHTLPVLRPELASPRTLERPLECGVTVIAAHCATKSGLFDPDYFDLFTRMLDRYPNLYGDNSAFTVPIRGRHVRECMRAPRAGRILHGSDFPVPVLGHWAWLRGLIDWPTLRRCQAMTNLLERDYQLKKAMGFPPESFTRAAELLRARPQAKTHAEPTHW